MIILAVIIIAALFMGSIIYFTLALLYKYCTVNGRQTITYDEFIKLYTINPNAWSIDWIDSVHYNGTCIYMKSYFDNIRLVIFKRRIEKQLHNKSYNRKRAELIELWQKDIDDYKKKYTEELKNMREDILGE